MARPVGSNSTPLARALGALRHLAHHAAVAAREIGGEDGPAPVVREVGLADIRAALHRGAEDFGAFRTDVVFIILIYPLAGLWLTAFAFQRDLLPLLFPLVSGFALLGPVAAIGLYEMSRRREAGTPAGYRAALEVIGSPVIWAVLAVGLGLLAVFAAWLGAAWLIFAMTLGPEPPASATAFLREVFTTAAGWAMLVIGCSVGFVLAAVTLATTVVSIPLLLHRRVGVRVALATSLALTRRNPATVAAWGLVVAALLVLGTLPLFLGLIVAFPVLGHATWHFYRRAVD